MARTISVKPVWNKKNGQCTIPLPKKKLPKRLRENLPNVKKLNFLLEGWE